MQAIGAGYTPDWMVGGTPKKTQEELAAEAAANGRLVAMWKRNFENKQGLRGAVKNLTNSPNIQNLQTVPQTASTNNQLPQIPASQIRGYAAPPPLALTTPKFGTGPKNYVPGPTGTTQPTSDKPANESINTQPMQYTLAPPTPPGTRYEAGPSLLQDSSVTPTQTPSVPAPIPALTTPASAFTPSVSAMPPESPTPTTPQNDASVVYNMLFDRLQKNWETEQAGLQANMREAQMRAQAQAAATGFSALGANAISGVNQGFKNAQGIYADAAARHEQALLGLASQQAGLAGQQMLQQGQQTFQAGERALDRDIQRELTQAGIDQRTWETLSTDARIRELTNLGLDHEDAVRAANQAFTTKLTEIGAKAESGQYGLNETTALTNAEISNYLDSEYGATGTAGWSPRFIIEELIRDWQAQNPNQKLTIALINEMAEKIGLK